MKYNFNNFEDIRITRLPTHKLSAAENIKGKIETPDSIFSMITNPIYKNVGKDKRNVVTSTYTGYRVIKNRDIHNGITDDDGKIIEYSEYTKFNGLQVLDIDIKNRNSALAVKEYLIREFKYGWVHTIALSTSGNGLHIYTYNKMDIEYNAENTYLDMYEKFLAMYEFKSICLWGMLSKFYDELIGDLKSDTQNPYIKKFGLTEFDIKQISPIHNTTTIKKNAKRNAKPEVIDAAMCKIQQLAFITTDVDAFKNPKFIYNTLASNRLSNKEIYDRYDNKYELNTLRRRFLMFYRSGGSSGNISINIENSERYNFDGLMPSVIPTTYGYEDRFRIAYAFVELFGVESISSGNYQKVLDDYLYLINADAKPQDRHEYIGYFNNAVMNTSSFAEIEILRMLKVDHNFNIKFKSDREVKRVIKDKRNEIINEKQTSNAIEEFIKADYAIPTILDYKVTNSFELKSDQYIGTFSKEIKNILQNGVNYLIARPGLGKTEFIKSLSQDEESTDIGDEFEDVGGFDVMNNKNRVLLVVPFTSILISKIEGDDSLAMDCYYGNKSTGMIKNTTTSVAMTYDKFSNLTVDDVSLFDYVAIDESHLLSCSSYRGQVPAKVIDICNDLTFTDSGERPTKIIMMTGTPMCEFMLFDSRTIMEFKKPEFRNKEVNFIQVKDNDEKLTVLCEYVADRIIQGDKILFPTNKGDRYVYTIKECIKRCLISKGFVRTLNTEYYKKENNNLHFSGEINNNATLGNLDILFCTAYLSVGIDINDTCSYSIIYSELFCPEHIEQFNCRLRKTNLHTAIFFSTMVSDGKGLAPKDLITDYKFTPEPLSEMRAAVIQEAKVLQEIIKPSRVRGGKQTKRIDGIGNDLIIGKQYLAYDRTTKTITPNITAFKIKRLESIYVDEWGTQLSIVAHMLRVRYGYKIIYKDLSESIEEIRITEIVAAKRLASEGYSSFESSQVAKLLNILNTRQNVIDFINLSEENIEESNGETRFETKGSIVILKTAYKKFVPDVKRLYKILFKYYSYDKIKDIIMDYCIKSGQISKSKSKNLIKAVEYFGMGKNHGYVQSNIDILKAIMTEYVTDYRGTEIYNDDFESMVDYLSMVYMGSFNKEIIKNTDNLFIETKKSIETYLKYILNKTRAKVGSDGINKSRIYSLTKLPLFNSADYSNKASLLQVYYDMTQSETLQTDKILLEGEEFVIQELDDHINTDDEGNITTEPEVGTGEITILSERVDDEINEEYTVYKKLDSNEIVSPINLASMNPDDSGEIAETVFKVVTDNTEDENIETYVEEDEPQVEEDEVYDELLDSIIGDEDFNEDDDEDDGDNFFGMPFNY